MEPKDSVVAIVQARMKSTRLPGKVLRELDGEPILKWVVERLGKAQWVQRVLVATTTDPSDDAVARFCRQNEIACVRGNMHDVLDRFYQAARQAEAGVIVRVTADCPLIDPALVDETVQAFLGADAAPGPFDFAANRLPPPFRRTYPIGLDTEVCTFAALERAWREADRPYQREHVMPYFYEGITSPLRIEKANRPGYLEQYRSPRGFNVLLLHHDQDCGSLRWTVDTPSDLALLEQIVRRLKDKRKDRRNFAWQEVLGLVQQEPELLSLNADASAKDFRESELPT